MEVPPKVQVVFHLAEVGQDFQMTPFIIAPGRPVVIVLRDAATCPLMALEPPVALPRGMVSWVCCGVTVATNPQLWGP